MFAYCGNNPVCLQDSSGTYCFSACGDQGDALSIIVNPVGLGGIGGGGYAGNVSNIVKIAVGLGAGVVIADQAKGLAQTIAQVDTEDPPIDYTVYFLCRTGDPTRTICYVGCVKTANFASRMNYHNARGRTYVQSVSGLDYDTCRVMEHAGMMYFHSINRNDSACNQIRGIGPRNGRLTDYFRAGITYAGGDGYAFGNIIPISYWVNLTEETFLNGGM